MSNTTAQLFQHIMAQIWDGALHYYYDSHGDATQTAGAMGAVKISENPASEFEEPTETWRFLDGSEVVIGPYTIDLA